MTLGTRLKELRRKARLTQRQLAGRVGVDFSYVSKMENDRLEHKFAGHPPIPISVAFSRDGRWLASGDWQGRINLWDPDGRGGPVRTFVEDGSPVSALAFRPAGSASVASPD